jgi:hypothetical protein
MHWSERQHSGADVGKTVATRGHAEPAPCRNLATLVCGAIQPWHGSCGDGSCMYVYVNTVHVPPRRLDTLVSPASAPIPL